MIYINFIDRYNILKWIRTQFKLNLNERHSALRLDYRWPICEGSCCLRFNKWILKVTTPPENMLMKITKKTDTCQCNVQWREFVNVGRRWFDSILTGLCCRGNRHKYNCNGNTNIHRMYIYFYLFCIHNSLFQWPSRMQKYNFLCVQAWWPQHHNCNK